MCGIWGQFNFDKKPASKDLVKEMAHSLGHRGPDNEGFYFNNDIGLGHRRLSIIDLDTGNQPMSNEDGTIWIVSNSEIYNFIELRNGLESKGHSFSTKSDTEVIIHLYEEPKEGCLDKLMGMFAFAIPLDIWLWQKCRFRDLIYDVIFDSRTKKRGYFNYNLIGKMFYEHERLIKLLGHRFWTLFMYELWHRNFLDKRSGEI
jgi:asparagine synthetase B (glutamine-hydrolysing)